MGRVLLIEMRFLDGVDEDAIRGEVHKAIEDSTPYIVDDMFWEDDKYNDEEEEPTDLDGYYR